MFLGLRLPEVKRDLPGLLILRKIMSGKVRITLALSMTRKAGAFPDHKPEHGARMPREPSG
jgi:hypothetical protein